MTQSPRPHRRRRRYGVAPRRAKNPWISGIYAAVLFVVLMLVLIFIRYFSPGVATAVLAVADLPSSPTTALETPTLAIEARVQEAHILDARNELFGAIYAAQRVALEALTELEASDETP